MGLFKRFTLKFKLMLSLVTLTGTMLSLYGWLALRDFQKDKTAYVFDSNLSHARSTSNQIRSELDFVIEKVRLYIRGYDSKQEWVQNYQSRLFSEDKFIRAIWDFRWDEAQGDFARSDLIQLDQDKAEPLAAEHQELIQAALRDAQNHGLALRTLPGRTDLWLLGLRSDSEQNSQPLMVIALLEHGKFIESFSNSQMQDTYLVNANNDVIVSPYKASYNLKGDYVSRLAKETRARLGAPAGIHEYIDPQKNSWLTSLSEVGAGELAVVSVIPKEAALEAVWILIIKSILFALFLLCITVFFSVIGSVRLTATLKTLLQATQKIRQGDFDITVDVTSEDEVGGLARGFNQMAQEIQRLLIETAEKARMEGELQTARVVQSTLFPKDSFDTDKVEIRGFYQPASECGGDWWNYTHAKSKVFFWIGDATGHGVPAALVTSAAKSASQILENFPDLSLSQIMRLLNQAIYGTARGQVLMTFFIGCLDQDTGEFRYCNASHDPPLRFPFKADGPLKKRDLEPLIDNTGPRLGENADSAFEETAIQLTPGDKIIFYTDGVTELKNKDGEMWGERQFLKTLLSSFNEDASIEDAMDRLATNIKEFRENHPLEDDVTYFLFKYKNAA